MTCINPKRQDPSLQKLHLHKCGLMDEYKAETVFQSQTDRRNRHRISCNVTDRRHISTAVFQRQPPINPAQITTEGLLSLETQEIVIFQVCFFFNSVHRIKYKLSQRKQEVRSPAETPTFAALPANALDAQSSETVVCFAKELNTLATTIKQ